jgi:hypothetical protein
MSAKTAAQKLGITQASTVCPLNAPDGYAKLVGLPSGATLLEDSAEPADVVHLFVRTRAEVKEHVQAAIEASKRGGLLWLSYPKQDSELGRLELETAFADWDLSPVASISVDDTWTAIRYRPESDLTGEA